MEYFTEDTDTAKQPRGPAKLDLPALDKSLLNLIFSNVYSNCMLLSPNEFSYDEKINSLIATILFMQKFNVYHRASDIRQSVEKLDKVLHFFWGDSEGVDWWLGMIHAVRELYGLSEQQLIKCMRQVDVRE